MKTLEFDIDVHQLYIDCTFADYIRFILDKTFEFNIDVHQLYIECTSLRERIDVTHRCTSYVQLMYIDEELRGWLNQGQFKKI